MHNYHENKSLEDLTSVFWFVWNEIRGLPRHKHPTEEAARHEAERLARVHPGERFHVLRSIGTVQTTNPVKWVSHKIKQKERENDVSHWISNKF